jgi:hypothetical protein
MLAAARFPCFYESVFQQPGVFSEVRSGKQRPSNAKDSSFGGCAELAT